MTDNEMLISFCKREILELKKQRTHLQERNTELVLSLRDSVNINRTLDAKIKALTATLLDAEVLGDLLGKITKIVAGSVEKQPYLGIKTVAESRTEDGLPRLETCCAVCENFNGDEENDEEFTPFCIELSGNVYEYANSRWFCCTFFEPKS
jgi:uncharacterized protein YigA (DUF484 family)